MYQFCVAEFREIMRQSNVFDQLLSVFRNEVNFVHFKLVLASRPPLMLQAGGPLRCFDLTGLL